MQDPTLYLAYTAPTRDGRITSKRLLWILSALIVVSMFASSIVVLAEHYVAVFDCSQTTIRFGDLDGPCIIVFK